jgi:hypothetical protein
MMLPGGGAAPSAATPGRVNQEALRALLGMGYEERRAVLALRATGSAGVEQAVEWLLAREESPRPAPPPLSQRLPAGGAAPPPPAYEVAVRGAQGAAPPPLLPLPPPTDGGSSPVMALGRAVSGVVGKALSELGKAAGAARVPARLPPGPGQAAAAAAAAARARYAHQPGALAVGNDVTVADCTLPEAFRKASELPSVVGFTFASPTPAPDGRVRCFFKSTYHRNRDPAWQSYLKPPASEPPPARREPEPEPEPDLQLASSWNSSSSDYALRRLEKRIASSVATLQKVSSTKVNPCPHLTGILRFDAHLSLSLSPLLAMHCSSMRDHPRPATPLSVRRDLGASRCV